MFRLRDNSSITVGPWTSYSYHQGLQTGTDSGTISVTNPDWLKDVATPGFRKRVAAGEIIISPYERLVGVRAMQNTIATVAEANYSFSLHGCQYGDLSPPRRTWEAYQDEEIRGEVSTLQTLAITDAYAKVGSPDLAVLTELVELKETLGFLYSPVGALVKLTRRMTKYAALCDRLTLRHAAKVAKWKSLPPRVQKRREPPGELILPKMKLGKIEASDVSSAWLAYRYAIMPLIYTFQDVQALMKKRAEGPSIRATARAQKGKVIKLNRTTPVAIGYYGTCVHSSYMEHVAEVRVLVNAGVLYTPEWTLANQLGFSINRIPMALYEGIPLSFVADWFQNGASVYDALTAEFRALKILGAWVTTEIDFSSSWTSHITTISGGSTYEPGTVLTYNGKWRERKLTSLADVGFKFHLELSGKRIADGLALIHTMLATANKKKKVTL